MEDNIYKNTKIKIKKAHIWKTLIDIVGNKYRHGGKANTTYGYLCLPKEVTKLANPTTKRKEVTMDYENNRKPTFKVVKKLRLLSWLQNAGYNPIKTEEDKYDSSKCVFIFLYSDELQQEIENYYHSPEFLAAQKDKQN